MPGRRDRARRQVRPSTGEPAGSAERLARAHGLPGLYVVALTNLEPISVNARNPRLAARCIKVNHEHCKFGKTRNLALRQRSYWRTFGRGFVRFRPIALLEDIDSAERWVLERLSAWRVRGSTGRRNEWLAGISTDEVERIAMRVLAQAGIDFRAVDDALLRTFDADRRGHPQQSAT